MKVPRYLKCAVKSMCDVPFSRLTRLVCGEEWYSSSLCFWDMVENVSFFWRVLEVIWMLLSSVVSEDGLLPMVSRGWGDAIVSSSLLKKDAVGKNMSSVFDLFAPDPVCI